MTDVGVGEAAGTEPVAHVANIQSIPITKVKGASVEIDFDTIPDAVYKEMLYLGAKEYINSVKMSKIGAGLTKLEGAELKKAQDAVVAQAKANADAMQPTESNGVKPEFKFHGATKSDTKVSGAVNTEAMRLARNLVKDWMKSNGQKISHTPASEITAGAKLILSQMPDLYATAEANLKARAATPVKGIDLSAIIKADPKLVAKAEAAKEAKKKPGATISAKQAGMVAPKKKPTQATAH